ncbi:FadR/GntR family transcriptional regulator [Pedobacter sp. AW31-3R]|uniref:FadR/GntR family transcriptional regulator n=1 Tax=Pedobacter sp. AW31-3R TaxID=3445781 RepID=UPI003FA140D1
MKTKEKLSDKVIIAIKNDIAGGRLKKGEKIPSEPELMDLYQVGRSTIREAIKTLAISGILRVQQGSGTFVASKVKDETLNQRLRRADFEEVNAVRALMEKEIVRLACIHRTAEQLQLMQELLRKRNDAVEANAEKRCADTDIEFHITIAKASGNTILADIYQSFTKVIKSFFSKREDQTIAHFAKSQHLHEQLAQAIALRDEESAIHFIQHILDNNY